MSARLEHELQMAEFRCGAYSFRVVYRPGRPIELTARFIVGHTFRHFVDLAVHAYSRAVEQLVEEARRRDARLLQDSIVIVWPGGMAGRGPGFGNDIYEARAVGIVGEVVFSAEPPRPAEIDDLKQAVMVAASMLQDPEHTQKFEIEAWLQSRAVRNLAPPAPKKQS